MPLTDSTDITNAIIIFYSIIDSCFIRFLVFPFLPVSVRIFRRLDASRARYRKWYLGLGGDFPCKQSAAQIEWHDKCTNAHAAAHQAVQHV